MNTPIIICTRDRVRDLKVLTAFCEALTDRITFLDNASTYQPLLDYLAHTPHSVIRLERNWGHTALWQARDGDILTRIAPGERYVYTDPDIVPDPACPLDVLDVMGAVLDKQPMLLKCGLGLEIEDVPEENPDWEASREWETKLWADDRRVGWHHTPHLYEAPTDTTFALHQAGAPYNVWPAVRLGRPYVARHMSWYRLPDELDDEDRYYIEHASDASNWAMQRRGLFEMPDRSEVVL